MGWRWWVGRRSTSSADRSVRTWNSKPCSSARTSRGPWPGRAIPRDWNSGAMPETVSSGYDVIIVGAGPAGLTAAMYAGRGMLQAVTIERGAPGGELLNTDLIEDYPGFESVKGWDLAQKMHDHAKKFGAEIVTDMVESVRKGKDGVFEVRTARGLLYRAPTVILTAGGPPGKPGGPGAKGHAGKGLSYGAGGDRATLKVGGVFVFIGFRPNTDLVHGHVEHDAAGYFVTDDRMMTSLPGLFAAGDVRSQLTRQITTAVGDATTAAIAVEKYLAALREKERASVAS